MGSRILQDPVAIIRTLVGSKSILWCPLEKRLRRRRWRVGEGESRWKQEIKGNYIKQKRCARQEQCRGDKWLGWKWNERERREWSQGLQGFPEPRLEARVLCLSPPSPAPPSDSILPPLQVPLISPLALKGQGSSLRWICMPGARQYGRLPHCRALHPLGDLWALARPCRISLRGAQ